MFHLGDLLDAAAPATWHPETETPGQALLARYRRRVLSTRPDAAPALRLPDVQNLGPLRDAIAVGEDPRLAATVAGACIETPGLAFASPAAADKSRTWRRLAILSDAGVAGLLRLDATPRAKKPAELHGASLDICDVTDTAALHRLIEEVYTFAETPEGYVRDRGRGTAPRAVWVGTPSDRLDEDFQRRVGAIAAVAGYRLRVVYGIASRTRDALQEVADEAPEFVIVWSEHLPPRHLIERIRSVVPRAAIEEIESAELDDALDEARILCELIPVVARAPIVVGAPRTMSKAAKQAQERVEHLDIVDQALERARESPYESPAEVLSALLLFDVIAGEYHSGALRFIDIEQACGDRGLIYAPRVSPSALTKHGDRYAVWIDGVRRIMSPHLLFGGSWEPRRCARVYFYIDSTAKRIVVGHIGKHLPGGAD